MKTSLISPVLNEEKNIKQFLNSILIQTVRPDEVLIVDGGSKDNTYKILKKYSKKHKWIKIYKKIGFNISQGRNYAIKKSKGDIIFTCDSGTKLEKNWVKKILNGFKKNADVVFGTWGIEPSNIIEKFLVWRTPNWGKINPDKFIPSNRQVAFKKHVWEKVRGFPEHLTRADDNWFHLRAHDLGFKYHFVKNAKVSWILERNLSKMLKLAFLDSKTEGFSFMFIERRIYILEFLLLLLGINIILLGIFINLDILIYSIILGITFSIFIGGCIPYTKFKDIKLFFVGPFLTVLLYFAHVFGVLTGIFQRAYKKIEN